jgi:hypothetical protein
MSGRRCSSVEGRSAGISGATSWSMVLPRAIGPRVAAEQDRDEVFLRRDRLLEGRNRGQRLLVLRVDLHHFRLGDDAGFEAQVEQPRGGAEVPGRCLRNFQLAVECAQQDVAGGDAGHQRQHDATLRLFAGIDLRLRGLAEAAHATKQVELPGRTERCLVE